MSDDWAPDLYTFTDFREYLSAYYDLAKENNPAFSYRYFSRRAGYRSPNFLQLVIQGKRRLTDDGVRRFSKALKLTSTETRFFKNLVDFNQASTDEDRRAAFEKVAASRRFRQARKIDSALYRYASRWYFPAIREMAARADFSEDPEWIAEQLVPSITPSDAEEALEVLFDLELLERDEDGNITRGEPTLATSRVVRSLAVQSYHRQMLERAADSMSLFEAARRELAAVTVCTSPELVPDIIDRMRRFRDEIAALCDRDEDPSVVYQLNLQLFPLSRDGSDDDDEE